MLCAALLVATLSGAISADDNLAQNPGFETGTPGPGVATYWYSYSFSGSPAQYQIMSYITDPWAVYEDAQSQMWYSSAPTSWGGIYQEVTGVLPGETCELSVYYADPQSYSPTMFRVGIQPAGGPPNPTQTTYSGWAYVRAEWQQASVTATATGATCTVVLETMNAGTPGSRVVVDEGKVIMLPPCKTIANVPDAIWPPNNPLNVGDITNWCSPLAAVNVTWFWDKVWVTTNALGVNDNWVLNTSAAYIGWWMDTNNLGCANRNNGNPPTFPAAKGTYVGDIAPGLTDFVRWDGAPAHQPCNPPAVPPSKVGYDWSVSTKHNLTPNYNLGNALGAIKLEVDEGRPLEVTWSYWRLNKQTAVTDAWTGVTYYDWLAPAGGSQQGDPSEEWNNPDNNSGLPKGDQQIGHSVTVIGYCPQYDPDGVPPGGGPLPKDDWIVVHDTWGTTAKDVAVPWNTSFGFNAWVSNTFVWLPNTLSVAAGPLHPANHWTPVTTTSNIMAQIRLTAGPTEKVRFRSITLSPGGTGNSVGDLQRVEMYWDKNSNGLVDAGEPRIAFGNYAGAPPTLTLNVPMLFLIDPNKSRDVLVQYVMKANLASGNTYNFTATAVNATGQKTGAAATVTGLPFASTTKTLIPGPCVHIPNVPDTLQPPNDPLLVGAGNLTNWCGAAAAVNVTYYWDQVALDPRATNVNDAWAAATGEYYMGWWMDTNDKGCQFRMNGNPPLGIGNGTYVGDIAPGIAEYARWDATNSFGVLAGMSPPPFVMPVLPQNKQGYSWTVSSKHDQNCLWPQAWTDIKNEIDAGRPLLVTWRYWNPKFLVTVGIVEYYTWDIQIGGGAYGESWNNKSSQAQVGLGDGTIGHVTTAVGYCPNYDPQGGNNKLDWVIVHDTWGGGGLTGTDVAIPFWNVPLGQPNAWSPWAANTFVRLAAPTVGSLRITCPAVIWLTNWVQPGAQNIYVGNILLSAGATEDVVVNVVELKASGTGNDQNDISLVSLYYDDDNDGKFDPPGSGDPDLLIASGTYPADDGTLRLVMPGPSYFVVPKNTSKRLFVAYNMSNPAPVLKKYTCSISAIYATGGATFLPVTVTGLPYTGGTVGISQVIFPPPGGIGDWKKSSDGGSASLTGIDAPHVSSGVEGGVIRLGDRIYIEEEDRSSGICVLFGEGGCPYSTLPEGICVGIEGVIDTINGERMLVQPAILGTSGGTLKPALGLMNRALGGGDWLYDPETGAGQKGIQGAYGLNNIGLLARVWGKYTKLDATTFTVEDGSTTDGLPTLVKCIVPSIVYLSDTWSYVVVTGISSCEKEEGSGNLTRLIRVRKQDDIVPLL